VKNRFTCKTPIKEKHMNAHELEMPKRRTSDHF
jgi:hypothetical protein